MPIIHSKEEKPIKSVNYQSKAAFLNLPVDIKFFMVRTFLSTKELGQLAKVSRESRTLTTQCNNKEYLTLIEGQKIINAAKKSLKSDDVFGLQTLQKLESHYGLLILGEKLLTLETIKQIDLTLLLKIICTSHGLTALREKLITLPQAKQLGAIKLKDIFTENGLVALREKLITPQQADELNAFALKCLLRDEGLLALRNHVVTIGQAKALGIRDLKDLVATVNLAINRRR